MHRNCLVFLAISVLLAPAVSAQGLSGALVGTVRDEQGGVLPGPGPRHLSGPYRRRIDDHDERQRAAAVSGARRRACTPSTSSCRRVCLLPRGNISIGAGATLERTAVLTLAGVAESVVVEGGSRIEARSSGFETRFGPEYLQHDSDPAVQHVRPDQGRARRVADVAVERDREHGVGVRLRRQRELFLIDGTNFTCPCQGVSRAEPSVTSSRKCRSSPSARRSNTATFRVPCSTSSPGRAETDSSTTRRTTDRCPG